MVKPVGAHDHVFVELSEMFCIRNCFELFIYFQIICYFFSRPLCFDTVCLNWLNKSFCLLAKFPKEKL